MNYKLEKINDIVVFTLSDVNYELRSHPYEPCLYIYRDDEMIKILHNAFDVYDLVEAFDFGEAVVAADSKQFDKDSFCKVLVAALLDERFEMNWTFAAKLAGY